jgi:outer membrane protein OmpA-like peptidoglycan-associated protein
MRSSAPLLAAVLTFATACGQKDSQQLISSRFPAQAPLILAGEGFVPGGRGFVARPPAEKDPLTAAKLSSERHGGLRLELPASGSEAVVLSSLGFSVQVREVALTGTGASFHGAVGYSHARGASYWTAREQGFEEWVLVEDAGEGPVAQWELTGARLRQTSDAVEVLDGQGRPQFRVTAPVAFGPGGVAARAWLTVQGSTLSLHTDARGQALVDPLWTVSGTLASPRSGHTATLLPSGKVLVAGGADASGTALASAELYDPATGAWAPTSALTDARTQHVAVVLPNGRVLVAGGKSAAGDLSSAEEYDASTGAWSAAGAMSTARAGATATVLASGVVLVAGGADGVSVYPADRFQPATGAWSASGALGAGFTNHSATRLASGQVLIAGGLHSGAPLAQATLYQPADDSWTATGALTTARSHHTATLLSSGQVLIAGGRDATGALASAERFDLVGGAFSPAGSMTAARADHSATALPSGKVVFAGGVGPSGDVAALELYDVGSDTFTSAGALATARALHTATLLPSGRVLVAGGLSGATALASAERFDDAAPAWSAGVSVIAGRRGPTVSLLPTGKVLLAGGIDFAGGYLAHCELYDPVAGTWLATGSMSGARAYHTASVLNSGKVLVAGGFAGPVSVVSTAELFDPASGTWAHAAPLASARSEATSTRLSSGLVLVVGGRASSTGEIAAAETYDPATDSWLATGPLNVGRYLHTATLLPNGAVLIAGGGSAGGALASAETFDPVTRAWTVVGSMAEARARHTATLLPTGRLLVTGGDGAGAALASTELYDYTSGGWVAGPALSTARAAHAAALLPGGAVLLSGGTAGATLLASAELYDPENGQVFPAPTLPLARSGHTSLLMPTGKVMVLGGSASVATPNLTAVELYDEGRGAPLASAPTFAGPIPERTPSGPIQLTGAGFTGPAEDAFPLVRVEREGGDAALYSTGRDFSATTASAVLPAVLPGWYWVRVVSGGVVGPAHSMFVFPSIILSPAATPPLGWVGFTASGGSGTFTWSLAQNPSGGTIDPASGLYQAGAVGSVTDVVKVTDSSGNFVTADITVGPMVSITPVTVAPRQALALAAVGGSGAGFVWSIQTAGAGGSIDPTSGVYTAPPTSGVDVVHVVDSLGNVATATVTVGPIVTLTPVTVDVFPRGTASYSAVGGAGAGYSWSLQTNASGGTIDAVTGAYTAGPFGNTVDVVLVQDPLGNTATGTVNIGISIAVTPATANVTPRGSLTFSASGGANAGFVWAFFSNVSGGTIDPVTGAYTAGAVGSVTDILQVTDPLGNIGTATLSVGPAVSISPVGTIAPPRGAVQLVASGGVGSGFTWSLCTNASGGAIDASTGLYHAGATPAVSDLVCVVDPLGNTATHTQEVGPGVSIQGGATIPLRGSQVFTAAGGSHGGYVWSIKTNGSGGTIDDSSGVYKAGHHASTTDVVQVTDSLGNSASVGVAVGPDIGVTAPAGSVPPRSSHALVAAGGLGSAFTWSLKTNSSGASLDAASGAYQAGVTGLVTDEVSVVDPLGNSATVSIIVGPGVSISPAAVSCAPRQVVNLVAAGGTGAGYVWSMVSAADGTVGASGSYQAGPSGNHVEVVKAKDPLGNEASVTITVGPTVAIVASATQTPPRGALSFSATGGAGAGYQWSFVRNGSGGTIDAASGAYRAGPDGDTTDEVRLADPLGNEATLEVQVSAGVSIGAGPRGLSPGDQFTFVASGGSNQGFVWELATNQSGGAIDAKTGVYTSGPRRNDADVVLVTDSLGNVAHANVIVWPAWSVAGSGCSSTGGVGSAWLALLGLFLFFRRRPVPAVVRASGALFLGLFATSASAQTNAVLPKVSTDLVIERFQPAAGAFDVLGVESGQVPKHLGWGLSLSGSYANQPLRLVAPGVSSVAMLKGQTTLGLGATLGLFDRVELSVVAPVTMGQRSQTSDNVPDAFSPAISSYGMSDVRIAPKVQLAQVGSLMVAVAAPVSLPTGDTRSFLGAGALTFAPRAIVEYGGLGPVRLLANAGALLRPTRQLIDVDIGNAFTYGAGAEATFAVAGQKLSGLATVVGEYGLVSTKAAASPVEALAGVRWQGPLGLGLTVGGGRGLTAGYGTPAYRLFAEMSITPDASPKPVVVVPPPPVVVVEAPKPPPPPVVLVAAPAAVAAPEPVAQIIPEEKLPPALQHIDGRIQFAFNRAEVSPKFRAVLTKVAHLFADQPASIRIRIEGFSDDVGSDEYNRELSVRRAANVRTLLLELGIPAARLEVVGHGKRDPIDTRPTAAAKALNRRVEFNFVSP